MMTHSFTSLQAGPEAVDTRLAGCRNSFRQEGAHKHYDPEIPVPHLGQGRQMRLASRIRLPVHSNQEKLGRRKPMKAVGRKVGCMMVRNPHEMESQKTLGMMEKKAEDQKEAHRMTNSGRWVVLDAH